MPIWASCALPYQSSRPTLLPFLSELISPVDLLIFNMEITALPSYEHSNHCEPGNLDTPSRSLIFSQCSVASGDVVCIASLNTLHNGLLDLIKSTETVPP